MQKKKSLGQHFLHNLSYLNRVADAAHIKKNENILEIGPGEGTLSAVLLERGATLTVIEKDSRLISVLQEKFKKEIAEKKMTVVEGDALQYTPPFKKYKVVGNIPYYISGALFKKFLTIKNQPTHLVFLVQKEVAERIARSKKESILSLSIKVYGEPRYLKTVPRGAFSPAPKVDSAILAVENISRKNFANAAHEKRFFELVRAGFSQKRKMLKSNLKKILGAKAEELGNVRAEDVPLAKWLEMSRS